MSWKSGFFFFILTFLVFLSGNDKYFVFIIILFSFWVYLKIMSYFYNFFKKFVDWCLRDGQKYAEQFGYTPLPEAVSNRAVQALAEVQ